MVERSRTTISWSDAAYTSAPSNLSGPQALYNDQPITILTPPLRPPARRESTVAATTCFNLTDCRWTTYNEQGAQRHPQRRDHRPRRSRKDDAGRRAAAPERQLPRFA